MLGICVKMLHSRLVEQAVHGFHFNFFFCFSLYFFYLYIHITLRCRLRKFHLRDRRLYRKRLGTNQCACDKYCMNLFPLHKKASINIIILCYASPFPATPYTSQEKYIL